MKIEFDPNELTAVQRSHVVFFINNWPESVRPKLTVSGQIEPISLTEEQRLHEEQIGDLGKQPDAAPSFADVVGAMIAPVGTMDITSLMRFAPPPPAPTPVPPVETVAPDTALVDKEGLPWDSRIHSSSKALVADGTWRLRRGVDAVQVAEVKDELRAANALRNFDITKALNDNPYPGKVITLPEGVSSSSLTHTFSVDNPDIVHSTGHIDYNPNYAAENLPAATVVDITQTLTLPITVTRSVVPSPPKSHYLIDQGVPIPPAPVTMNDLIGRISVAIMGGKLTKDQVTELCNKHGVTEFVLLSSHPELLPVIDNELKAMGV